ncbi:MAG TPA: glycerate kinase [Chloroflexi bacterium]|nr:glycerate kinase [Chloroflexota bacterium]
MKNLRFEDHVEHVSMLIEAALEAADPARALASNWPSRLAGAESCYVVGAGKASLEMAIQLEKLCGERLMGGAVAVVPERLEQLTDKPVRYRVFPAAHPLPDERNVRAAQAIAEVARRAKEDDTLIALISGGGSAHLTLPDGDLTLDDLRRITDALLRAGAPIRDLNTVRKHCERLKGGGLARLAYPAPVWAFILSDVMGDPLDVIASGPTAADPTTYADALAVLERYNVRDAVPAVTAHLEAGARGELPENPKPGDPAVAHVTNMIIGSNRLALEAARKRAAETGWKVVGFEFGVEGEAREQGERLARIARDLARRPDSPCCYLMGSETTVTVRGNGRGGRNQEMALAAALAIDGLENAVIATFATDGIDGPTDAAGAIVTGQTIARSREMGLDAQAYLDNNDSYTFFKQVGGLIRTGPTGTNVNDIAMVLVYSSLASQA